MSNIAIMIIFYVLMLPASIIMTALFYRPIAIKLHGPIPPALLINI